MAEPAPSNDPLSPEVFGHFLKWLSPDNKEAARIYLDLRKMLVQWFIRRGCMHSGEQADKTLDRVALIVYNDPGKYSSPIALSIGVARIIWKEYQRLMHEDVLETEEIPDDRPGKPNEEPKARCLDFCVNRLPDRERNLIIPYHSYRGREKIETRKRLAAENGGLNKLRITTHRIRLGLYKCIEDCLKQTNIQ